MTIWFASDGDHRPLIDAVAGAWQEVLGIQDIQLASEPGVQLIERIIDTDVTGPFHLTWQADVPSPVRVIEPLFGERGSANDLRFRSDDLDDLLVEAGLARDLSASLTTFAAAEAAAADVHGVALDGAGALHWSGLAQG